MLKYRHPTAEDIPKLNKWVAADPVHKDTMKGSDFVLEADDKGNVPKGIQCIEVRDEKGVVFYLRFRNALVVETQFPPTTDRREKVRIARALKEALAFFMGTSKGLGYHAMFFNSMSDTLIQFFEKLGFSRIKDFFKVDL